MERVRSAGCVNEWERRSRKNISLSDILIQQDKVVKICRLHNRDLGLFQGGPSPLRLFFVDKILECCSLLSNSAWAGGNLAELA